MTKKWLLWCYLFFYESYNKVYSTIHMHGLCCWAIRRTKFFDMEQWSIPSMPIRAISTNWTSDRNWNESFAMHNLIMVFTRKKKKKKWAVSTRVKCAQNKCRMKLKAIMKTTLTIRCDQWIDTLCNRFRKKFRTTSAVTMESVSYELLLLLFSLWTMKFNGM